MRRSRKSTVRLLLLFSVAFATAAGADEIAQGRALYLRYCACCHGRNGAGDGPLAKVLTTPPTNLRLLSDLYGNPLDENKVARAIDGRLEVQAHGPREMPVWGERFYAEPHGNELLVESRITKLVAYLQSIQTDRRHVAR